MTIEEAREVIKQFRDRQGNSSDDIEAFDLVIEVLEQQPNDCISREDVKEQMLKYGFNAPDMTVTEFVEDLPSVIPSYNSIKTELKPCEDWRFYYNHGYAQAKRDLLCEDCVSRTELLARIDAERKHLLDLKMDGAEHIIVHHARRIIEDMLSVTTKAEWIPCSDPLNELPKDRMLYVTTKWEYVETLYWDMTEWSDGSIARNTIAYMDYYEPEPYTESNKESDAE